MFVKVAAMILVLAFAFPAFGQVEPLSDKEEIRQLKVNVQSVADQTSKQLTSLEERLTVQINAVGSKVTAIEAKVNSHDDRLASIDAKQDAILKALAAQGGVIRTSAPDWSGATTTTIVNGQPVQTMTMPMQSSYGSGNGMMQSGYSGMMVSPQRQSIFGGGGILSRVFGGKRAGGSCGAGGCQ
jgi:hypothetical protein